MLLKTVAVRRRVPIRTSIILATTAILALFASLHFIFLLKRTFAVSVPHGRECIVRYLFMIRKRDIVPLFLSVFYVRPLWCNGAFAMGAIAF